MNLNKVRAYYLSGALFVIGVMLLIWDKYSPAYCLLIGASVFAIATEVWVQKAHVGKPAEAPQTPRPAAVSSEVSLQREIEALTKLVAAKTREAETLAAKLKDRRDLKILQRVGQFQHALDFNRAQIAGGKMSTEAAYREVELELEAALAELGISAHDIPLGIHVRKLPAESYELISAENPPSPEMAGTVNKVRQRALVYKDAAGQTHFLIPAKIDAYKI